MLGLNNNMNFLLHSIKIQPASYTHKIQCHAQRNCPVISILNKLHKLILQHPSACVTMLNKLNLHMKQSLTLRQTLELDGQHSSRVYSCLLNDIFTANLSIWSPKAQNSSCHGHNARYMEFQAFINYL